MNQFESLEEELYGKDRLTIERLKLRHTNGYYCRFGNGFTFLAVDKGLTVSEATCTAYHEVGHHYSMVMPGQEDRNENRADRWATKRLVPVQRLIDALLAGCRNLYEVAEHIGVSEKFLYKTLDIYQKMHGEYYGINEWTISFKPVMVHNYLTDQIFPVE